MILERVWTSYHFRRNEPAVLLAHSGDEYTGDAYITYGMPVGISDADILRAFECRPLWRDAIDLDTGAVVKPMRRVRDYVDGDNICWLDME